MNHLLLFLLGTLAVLLLAFGLWAALQPRHRGEVCDGANIAEGTHKDGLTGYADAAITTRHLLYKRGVAANTFAVSGATDLPLGTIADEVATADIAAVPITLKLLGKDSTKRMVASEAMATTGVLVYAAASGKIALSGSVAVGTLLTTASADGDVVEVQDGEPVVVANTESVITTNVIAASESGKTFFLNLAAGFVSTLPAPVAGMKFTFIVGTAPTGGAYTVVSASSANIIKGNQNSVAGDAGDFGTADDTVSFVANQAVAGDKVEFCSDGTSWFAYAISKVAAGVTFTQAS